MNPIILSLIAQEAPQLLSKLLPFITGAAGQSISSVQPDATPTAALPSSGVDPAVLAALIAAAKPVDSPAPLTLPRSASVIASVVVIGFFLILAAIAGLLLFGITPAQEAILAVLCVGFGVLASKFGTVVDFLFGSSWGSRAKDAVLAQPSPSSAPVLVPVPVPPTTALPAPVATPAPSGHVLTLKGKMSEFGGPSDKDSGLAEEGLALYDEAQAATRPDLFASVGPGLFRRLKPDALYMAARWDYKQTPASWLRAHKAKVTNPKTGKSVDVDPVDWGPNIKTGRTVDLSPGVCKVLGLETDDQVVVDVPLPGQAVQTSVIDAHAAQPTHPRILSDADLKATFGDFSYSEGNGGRIVIDPAWVAANIISVDVPQIDHLGVKSVECHRKIAVPLIAAWAEVEKAGLLPRAITWDGLWVPRHKTWNVSRGLSRHSWGIAFDINANWNSYDSNGAPEGAHGSVVDLVPIFERYGFAWGGLWSSSKDPMHFEFAEKA